MASSISKNLSKVHTKINSLLTLCHFTTCSTPDQMMKTLNRLCFLLKLVESTVYVMFFMFADEQSNISFYRFINFWSVKFIV